MKSQQALLDVEDLRTYFFTDHSQIPSVDGVTFRIKKGEKVAIVGESGCGKSVTSLSIMRLVAAPGKIVGGKIHFDGLELTSLSNKEMQKIRGNEIAMVFQEPLSSLNPVFTVGSQISESIRLHQKVSKEQAKEKSISLLRKVGIPRPDQVYTSFPHSLSGGMQQRVMIAMALSCNPKLLIADEPTTALDVTIQAQILHLMNQLSAEYGMAILLITHDLGVVAEMADRVIVMYAGQVVEETDVFTLFQQPRHPYTIGLLGSTPQIQQIQDELTSIDGTVPSPDEMPVGCRFHPRCPHVTAQCLSEQPVLREISTGHRIRCWLSIGTEVRA